MTFFIKKLISAAATPLSITILLSIIGLMLLWFSQQTKLAASILTVSLLILILFSITPTANFLVGNLENQYKPLQSIPKDVKTIVVLGGGTSHSPGNQFVRLSPATLARVVTAVELFKKMPQSRIIFTGGAIFHSPQSAKAMQNVAIALGIPKAQTNTITTVKNTYQEALALKSVIRKEKFILITSAYHMPRAMALFHKQGLNPIAQPTQYLTKYSRGIKYYLPNVTNLIESDLAIHEYLGLLWGKLANRI